MATRSGVVVDARYRLTELLARGGSAEIWAGLDERAGRPVAVKMLRAASLRSREAVQRFEREASIHQRIRSPFVCACLDAGRCADGRPFIVFEHLEGEDLDRRLKRVGTIAFDAVAPLVDGVLEGLAAAHAAGVIHRDMKPANVFVAREGAGERPKILDFGVSKLNAGETDGLTSTRATVGSIAYMAPEQYRGSSAVDARADLYAVGAMAFRALAGTLPFRATSAEALIALKLNQPAASLAESTGHAWPVPLERLLASALAPTPDARPRSALEMLSSWRALAVGGTSPQRMRARPEEPPPSEDDLGLDETLPLDPPKGRRKAR